MEYSVKNIPRSSRRRLRKIVQCHVDADYRRRANALLLLFEGYNISQTAQLLQASRLSVRTWRQKYETEGEQGIAPDVGGRPAYTVTDEVCTMLVAMIQESPGDSGYLRGRWTSEMLAEQIQKRCGQFIHPSTIRRLLPKLGIGWNRAKPTLQIKDKHKAKKMKAIKRALDTADDENPVFYVDEADIDLNPRMGFGWMIKGKQTSIPTPGKK